MFFSWTKQSYWLFSILFVVFLSARDGKTACAIQTLADQIPGEQVEVIQTNGLQEQRLAYASLPDLPDEFGVAGAFIGVENDHVIVAGGANFSTPNDPSLWNIPKEYRNRIWVLRRESNPIESNSPQDESATYTWLSPEGLSELPFGIAYGSAVSTRHGLLCLGGENESGPTAKTFLLRYRKRNDVFLIEFDDDTVPNLPMPSTSNGASIVGDYVYVVAGDVVDKQGVRASSRYVWRLNVNLIGTSEAQWEEVLSWPEEGPTRMFPLVTTQHNGFKDCLYVFGGRRVLEGTDPTDLYNLKFGNDCWVFDPDKFERQKNSSQVDPKLSPWKRLKDAPVSMAAGSASPLGPSHILVPNYDTGEQIIKQLDSKIPSRSFEHPGYPRLAYLYHTLTDTWVPFGETPINQVSTSTIVWHNETLLISGELRPRVRAKNAWRITVPERRSDFGVVNFAVVVIYLAAILLMGVYFTRRNKSTEDYFRAGKKIPWWAAGCSIFATMLSSITFMAIPAKAFAQDWVYAVGSVFVLLMAPVAIYAAMPFFRLIDATSAYEYLEMRYSRAVRMIGSGSFALFHVFRMGVVLALAGMALAAITPLSPEKCVLVMGLLAIVYCTLGGIEAVIWTDTVQTFVLIGGALVCLGVAWYGADVGSFDTAMQYDKLRTVDWNFRLDSFMTMAIWVVVLGAFGQNLSSYTSDQAVIQRYMTTPDQKMAARSIWLNGLMAIPTAILFFGMGTAFWMFYRSHPEHLEPTIATDGILPLFVSRQLPIGVAGLVVTGIFAAAQSTVSTSMNSVATTIVTDFMKPFYLLRTDRAYLWAARVATIVCGCLGILLGYFFVDPAINSLFDEFVSLLGIFLGMLAGLFVLGATTRRANTGGVLVGAFVAFSVMLIIVIANKSDWVMGAFLRESIRDTFGLELWRVHKYLYGAISILICYVVGYSASYFIPSGQDPLDGLTFWDFEPGEIREVVFDNRIEDVAGS